MDHQKNENRDQLLDQDGNHHNHNNNFCDYYGSQQHDPRCHDDNGGADTSSSATNLMQQIKNSSDSSRTTQMNSSKDAECSMFKLFPSSSAGGQFTATDILRMISTSPSNDVLAQNLFLLSQIPSFCLEMRDHLPILINLLHPHASSTHSSMASVDQFMASLESRHKLVRALHGIINNAPHSQTEFIVVQLLEDLHSFVDVLYEKASCSSNNCDTDDDFGSSIDHPNDQLASLVHVSTNDVDRATIEMLGGVHVVADILQGDYRFHGLQPLESIQNFEDSLCYQLRLYSLTLLVNMTRGNSRVKALIGSMKGLLKIVVDLMQHHSSAKSFEIANGCDGHALVQRAANLFTNLSFQTGYSVKQTMRDLNVLTILTKISLNHANELTLKATLNALANLTTNSPPNKADFCKIPGSIELILSTLNPTTLTIQVLDPSVIVESGGTVLRNISSYVAQREELRQLLRTKEAVKTLLHLLKSSRLAIVSNACNTLANLSAGNGCQQDQQIMLEAGAVTMLHNLTNSKHEGIQLGAKRTLQNLVNSPMYASNLLWSKTPDSSLNGNSFVHGQYTSTSLQYRKTNRMFKNDLIMSTNLMNTYDNMMNDVQGSANRSMTMAATNRSPSMQANSGTPLSMNGSVNKGVSRSSSHDSIGSTHSEPVPKYVSNLDLHNKHHLGPNVKKMLNTANSPNNQDKMSTSLHYANGSVLPSKVLSPSNGASMLTNSYPNQMVHAHHGSFSAAPNRQRTNYTNLPSSVSFSSGFPSSANRKTTPAGDLGMDFDSCCHDVSVCHLSGGGNSMSNSTTIESFIDTIGGCDDQQLLDDDEDPAPTDYSQRYKEQPVDEFAVSMDDIKDVNKSSLHSKIIADSVTDVGGCEDTVKVYQTEGTPLAFSLAPSLSDLRQSLMFGACNEGNFDEQLELDDEIEKNKPVQTEQVLVPLTNTSKLKSPSLNKKPIKPPVKTNLSPQTQVKSAESKPIFKKPLPPTKSIATTTKQQVSPRGKTSTDVASTKPAIESSPATKKLSPNPTKSVGYGKKPVPSVRTSKLSTPATTSATSKTSPTVVGMKTKSNIPEIQSSSIGKPKTDTKLKSPPINNANKTCKNTANSSPKITESDLKNSEEQKTNHAVTVDDNNNEKPQSQVTKVADSEMTTQAVVGTPDTEHSVYQNVVPRGLMKKRAPSPVPDVTKQDVEAVKSEEKDSVENVKKEEPQVKPIVPEESPVNLEEDDNLFSEEDEELSDDELLKECIKLAQPSNPSSTNTGTSGKTSRFIPANSMEKSTSRQFIKNPTFTSFHQSNSNSGTPRLISSQFNSNSSSHMATPVRRFAVEDTPVKYSNFQSPLSSLSIESSDDEGLLAAAISAGMASRTGQQQQQQRMANSKTYNLASHENPSRNVSGSGGQTKTVVNNHEDDDEHTYTIYRKSSDKNVASTRSHDSISNGGVDHQRSYSVDKASSKLNPSGELGLGPSKVGHQSDGDLLASQTQNKLHPSNPPSNNDRSSMMNKSSNSGGGHDSITSDISEIDSDHVPVQQQVNDQLVANAASSYAKRMQNMTNDCNESTSGNGSSSTTSRQRNHSSSRAPSTSTSSNRTYDMKYNSKTLPLKRNFGTDDEGHPRSTSNTRTYVATNEAGASSTRHQHFAGDHGNSKTLPIRHNRNRSQLMYSSDSDEDTDISEVLPFDELRLSPALSSPSGGGQHRKQIMYSQPIVDSDVVAGNSGYSDGRRTMPIGRFPVHNSHSAGNEHKMPFHPSNGQFSNEEHVFGQAMSCQMPFARENVSGQVSNVADGGRRSKKSGSGHKVSPTKHLKYPGDFEDKDFMFTPQQKSIVKQANNAKYFNNKSLAPSNNDQNNSASVWKTSSKYFDLHQNYSQHHQHPQQSMDQISSNHVESLSSPVLRTDRHHHHSVSQQNSTGSDPLSSPSMSSTKSKEYKSSLFSNVKSMLSSSKSSHHLNNASSSGKKSKISSLFKRSRSTHDKLDSISVGSEKQQQQQPTPPPPQQTNHDHLSRSINSRRSFGKAGNEEQTSIHARMHFERNEPVDSSLNQSSSYEQPPQSALVVEPSDKSYFETTV